MSNDARKKEKHRLKRLNKKKEARRMESVSPFRCVALLDGTLECYTTVQSRPTGLGDYMILGSAPGGSYVVVGILIDFYCVGLKDIWGRPLASRAAFEEEILEPWRERAGKLVRVDAAKVRAEVAGAIRFSRQNGFRLPEHWERYAAIFGDLGDVRTADLSAFGFEGGLQYIGEFDFLKKRLIGCTVEQFLNRPEVKYITSADSLLGDFEENDEDFDAQELMPENRDSTILADAIEQGSAAIVRQYCERHDITPHPMLDEAASVVAEAIRTQLSGTDAYSESADVLVQAIERVIETRPEAQREQLRIAVEQIRRVGGAPDEGNLPTVGSRPTRITPIVDAEWSREVSSEPVPATQPQARSD